MVILLYVLGWAISLLALYLVIRFAVQHAIVATRPKVVTPREEPPPPKTWFSEPN